MRILFLLFLIVPVVEMWVLIEVGSRIGAWPTIALVLLTAVVGVALLRQQGFSTLMRANQRLSAGQLPASEMAEGMFLAVGGALLLTPGFVTDAVGFACLIPWVRRWLIARLMHRLIVRQYPGGGPGSGGPEPRRTIDGEYRRED